MVNIHLTALDGRMKMSDERTKYINCISTMKTDGEYYYFNMFQDGGSVCYYCNGYFLLFSVPLHGGEEGYEGTYHHTEIEKMVDEALSWS